MSKSTRLQKIRPPCAREWRGKLFHSIGIGFRGDILVDAAAIVNVVNFADAEDRNVALLQNIEQHRFRRIDSIIMAAGGAHEIPWCASKWTGDHAADTVLAISNFRAISHMRYNSANGITSSCAAI